MKAYYIEAPQQITPKDIEIPTFDEDELLVRVADIGICGSDLHIYKGSYSGPFSYPLLFGHEWSGRVEAIGAKVTAFEPGDKVTGDCSCFCGECGNCQIDRNLCTRIEKFGITTNGASAEFIVRNEKYLYKAPDDMPLEILCLAEPLAVAFHLLNKIKELNPDLHKKKILICGGGPIGIGALVLLKRHFLCENVDLIDIAPNRLALAESLGAGIPDPGELATASETSSYSSLYSGLNYDIIVETTGVAKVIADTITLVKPLGTIGLLGMVPEVTINQKNIVVKGLKLVGSIGGTGEFPDVIDFISKNMDSVLPMISHRFSIKDVTRAFEMATSADKVYKVLLEL